MSEGETEEKVVLKNKLGFEYGGNHFSCGVKASDERNRRVIERIKKGYKEFKVADGWQ